MLEEQPDEVVAATLWELEATVAATLPWSALIRATRSDCGSYNVQAKWPWMGSHGNSMLCALAIHFPAAESRVYCALGHPGREEVRRRIGEWLSAELESQFTELTAEIGFSINRTVPTALFFDDVESIRVTAQDKRLDFALYRGAPPPQPV
ncbi:hypothetical protein PQH03_21735 [Ralstonia insidiosa]|jgi:hypothetical protein|uniref:hypothetical protein n=1 Tax=Ralstonia TaxID=48736 RepID=UPI000664B3C7|nr:hypothetical protein [Ralstonia insidiosa]KMW48588.1 hypothetical protein AC240_03450 [Ralstonia sp. MD27]MBX3772699.1 hypothetical protein [Ralstonia pickettii]NOZ17613.1 hypothetical protein [Betaproteobacteria bacterium]MBA9856523.1 hypothetical protein [Ralstonia insidiosa]MBA9869124.1 hypothetical protein [Ralstonia insidiosa]